MNIKSVCQPGDYVKITSKNSAWSVYSMDETRFPCLGRVFSEDCPQSKNAIFLVIKGPHQKPHPWKRATYIDILTHFGVVTTRARGFSLIKLPLK